MWGTSMEHYKTEDLNIRTIAPAEPIDAATEVITNLPPALPPPLPSTTHDWLSRHGSALAVGALMGTAFASFFIGLEAHRSSHSPEAQLPASIPPILREEPSPSTPQPAAPAPADADTILLSATVTPLSAAVIVDGNTMPSNPFIHRYPRSPTKHRIVAIAPGYEAKEREVSFSDNVMLDLSLTPLTAAAGPKSDTRTLPPRKVTPLPALSPSTAPSRKSALTPPRKPIVAAPPAPVPAPPPHTASPNDIVPHNQWGKPRPKQIDPNNPYTEDP